MFRVGLFLCCIDLCPRAGYQSNKKPHLDKNSSKWGFLLLLAHDLSHAFYQPANAKKQLLAIGATSSQIHRLDKLDKNELSKPKLGYES